ncbi:S41 family peptidase [Erythrobacter sp. GH1-10]|uniref:S41 family peptidase n=1 Tax=Erythrobacter sp. GH1-10 TaxID=3349334 RepID=UPI00387835E3
MTFNRVLAAVSAVLLAVPPAPALAEQTVSPSAQFDEASDTAARLARLVEVWGFVKYHHTDSREGRLAMDQAFFELYPQIAGAGSMAAADRVLIDWLDRIGIGAPCEPCGGDMLPEADDIALIQPTNGWTLTLPEPLALRIKAIYENRSAATANFQIEGAWSVGNAVFVNEADYKATARDDPALRMLALARIWNSLRYWFPYRDVMDEDVGSILAPAIADVLTAETREAHQRALLRLVAKADDGHAIILGFEDAMLPYGDCVVPFSWRFLEGRLVVDGATSHQSGVLKRGDIVLAIGGESVETLDDRYSPMISGSNDAYRLRRLSVRLARWECGERLVTVKRDGKAIDLAVDWIPETEAGVDLWRNRDRDGPNIQQLDGGITYVRYAELTRDELRGLPEIANKGAGLVLDMRGYARNFHAYDIGMVLIDQPVEFARMTQPSLATPGLFTWTKVQTLKPAEGGPRIEVPVVALVDEGTASSPEFQAMILRASGVTIIGSTTAGADGNVSVIRLPQDSAQMRFSGIGVFYPDGSPTQRIGIVPDIKVEPTIAGITAGRDEILERALAELRSRAE